MTRCMSPPTSTQATTCASMLCGALLATIFPLLLYFALGVQALHLLLPPLYCSPLLLVPPNRLCCRYRPSCWCPVVQVRLQLPALLPPAWPRCAGSWPPPTAPLSQQPP